MSKKNLKIKFSYADTTIAMQWKGHPYQKQSVEDFLNCFVDMLGLGLEVRERKPTPKTKITQEKPEQDLEVDFQNVEQSQTFESTMNHQPKTNN